MLITVKYAEMRRRQMKITDTIKYVGVNDETIDLFEGQYRMLMQGLEITARHPIAEVRQPPDLL